jgi:hypothetical protein
MATMTEQQILLRKHFTNVPGKKIQPTVKSNHFLYQTDNRGENRDSLEKSQNYWMNLAPFRKRTERAWRYRRGNQWEDLVDDPDVINGTVKEKDVIEGQGQIAMSVNLIAPAIRAIKGQFRAANSRSNVVARTREDAPIGEMLTNTIKAIYEDNEGDEEDAAALDIFTSSGAGIQRVDYKYNDEKSRSYARFWNCEMSEMAFNPVKRRDMSDLDLVSQFHDMSLERVIAGFAYNKTDEAKIRQIYGYVSSRNHNHDEHFTEDWVKNREFTNTYEGNLCRVHEIWEKKGVWKYWFHDWGKVSWGTVKMTPENKMKFDQENAERIMMCQQNGIDPSGVLIEYREKFIQTWFFKFITPNCETLLSGETPYRHKSHPFVFLLHPLIRGEVWGFVEDIIDLQRKFNRDLILKDFVIGSGAKGVLLFDENSETEDYPLKRVLAEYPKRNGVIVYDGKKGEIPQQMVNKGVPAGLDESLAFGLQLMNSNSGVSDAMKGATPTSGTPSSLYMQSAQNSTLNIKDYLDAFNSFRTRRDRKLLEVHIQYAPDKEYLPISGQNYSEESKIWDRSKIKDDLTYVLKIDQTTDSRVYRSIIDEQLLQFVAQGVLPFEIYLKNSSIPNADKILADLDELKKQAAQGNIPQQGATPQMVQALQGMGANPQNANPQALEMMNRYAGNAPQAPQ